MKTYSILLFNLLLLQGITLAQSDATITNRTGENVSDSLSHHGIIIFQGTTGQDSMLISEAMRYIEKSRKLTNYGIAFGSMANLSILMNVGVLRYSFEDWQLITAICGAGTGAIRLGMSFATPQHLRKAGDLLLQVRDKSGGVTLFENSLHHIEMARKTAIAVPFLGLAGMALLPVGIVGLVDEETYGTVCWIAGWACAATGLTCTIISSSHISKAKESLQEETAGLKLGMNKYGIGISYRF